MVYRADGMNGERPWAWRYGTLGCRLDIPGKTEPQLTNCLYQICLWGISRLMILEGPHQLWAVRQVVLDDIKIQAEPACSSTALWSVSFPTLPSISGEL